MKLKIIWILIILTLLIVGCDSEETYMINGVEYGYVYSMKDGFKKGNIYENDVVVESHLINPKDEIIFKGVISEAEADQFYINNSYYFIVLANGKKGVINEKGEEIFPIVIDESYKLDNEAWITSESDFIPFTPDSASDIERKWGYIDRRNGDIVIDPQYTEASAFENGVATVYVKETSNFTSDWGAENVTMEDTEYVPYYIDIYNNILERAN